MDLDRKQLAIAIAASFIILTSLIYFTWNNSLNAAVDIGNFSSTEKNIGYNKFYVEVSNYEEESIEPIFYMINNRGKGPYMLIAENDKSISAYSTAKFNLTTLEDEYLTTKPSTSFTIIVKDRKTGRFLERIVEIENEYPETAYRNPGIRTYESKPAGWIERFRGDIDDYKVKKNLTGVLIESEGGDSDFGYFLTQKYNLTEKVRISASFENLENAETGFRILEEKDDPGSQNGLLTVDVTENMSSGTINEVYDTSKLYKGNSSLEKGDTVQIQFFFDSEHSGPNWLYLDRLKAFNQ